MSRAAVLLLSVPLLAVAAPAVKGKAVHFYPTRVGDTLVYEGTDKDAAYRKTIEVTTVETRDGTLHVTGTLTLDLKDDRVTQAWTMEVSAGGVAELSVGARTLPTSRHLLRLPAKAGESWNWHARAANGLPAEKMTYTTGKEEEVEVPAGKFKAVRVDTDAFRNGERSHTSSHWYAPGVGVVKMIYNGGTTERTWVLKLFTPGK